MAKIKKLYSLIVGDTTPNTLTYNCQRKQTNLATQRNCKGRENVADFPLPQIITKMYLKINELKGASSEQFHLYISAVSGEYNIKYNLAKTRTHRYSKQTLTV